VHPALGFPRCTVAPLALLSPAPRDRAPGPRNSRAERFAPPAIALPPSDSRPPSHSRRAIPPARPHPRAERFAPALVSRAAVVHPALGFPRCTVAPLALLSPAPRDRAPGHRTPGTARFAPPALAPPSTGRFRRPPSRSPNRRAIRAARPLIPAYPRAARFAPALAPPAPSDSAGPPSHSRLAIPPARHCTPRRTIRRHRP
jgi:hypothetical protein